MAAAGVKALSVPRIHARMTLLDIVSDYEETIVVFNRYDAQAGECLCCHALFMSVGEAAQTYRLDLNALLKELNTAADRSSSRGDG